MTDKTSDPTPIGAIVHGDVVKTIHFGTMSIILAVEKRSPTSSPCVNVYLRTELAGPRAEVHFLVGLRYRTAQKVGEAIERASRLAGELDLMPTIRGPVPVTDQAADAAAAPDTNTGWRKRIQRRAARHEEPLRAKGAPPESFTRTMASSAPPPSPSAGDT